MIGLEISRQPLSQSDAKLNPFETRSFFFPTFEEVCLISFDSSLAPYEIVLFLIDGFDSLVLVFRISTKVALMSYNE